MNSRSRLTLLLVCIALWLNGCAKTPAAGLTPRVTPAAGEQAGAAAGEASPAEGGATETGEAAGAAAGEASPSPETPAPTASVAPTPVATPAEPEAVCGAILPVLPPAGPAPQAALEPDEGALARLQEMMPAEARPALGHLLAAPESVGLAAYRVGQEGEGAYLNAAVPMPLASVVKVIHLVAYAEAVAAGRLDPFATVWLDELEAFYQPGLDLGAYDNAVARLEADGRVFAQPPAVVLHEVPAMMIEFSANAASDYLHLRLGQATIEQTAVDLGLSSQSAPCPFVGQFLAMANHTRPLATDLATVRGYLADPAAYGREVMRLTEAFSGDEAFRREAVAWRRETGRPESRTQRFFAASLNAHGSAADYAGLMARIAQNGLSNGEASYTARRILEWPMQYEVNQELFANLGYKNGALPGVLTTVYYAYRPGDVTPVVVALFFRDLDGGLYRQWRATLAHDELARWLLADPAAIPALRAILEPAG
jgi:beta-lactamase class A